MKMKGRETEQTEKDNEAIEEETARFPVLVLTTVDPGQQLS